MSLQDKLFPQSGDPNDAALFAQLAGHRNNLDYVASGLGVTVNYTEDQVTVGEGVCYISQGTGTTTLGESVENLGYAVQVAETTVALADPAGDNYVVVEPTLSTENSVNVAVYTDPTLAGDPSLVVAYIDAVGETEELRNRHPVATFDSVVVEGEFEVAGGFNSDDGLTISGNLETEDGEVIWDDLAKYIPQARLENDGITVTGSNGLSGGSASLGGSLDVGVDGDFQLDAGLLAFDGTTIWDDVSGHIPQARLENDEITISGSDGLGGGVVALGGTVDLGITGSLRLATNLVSGKGDTIWDHDTDTLVAPADVDISGDIDLSGGEIRGVGGISTPITPTFAIDTSDEISLQINSIGVIEATAGQISLHENTDVGGELDVTGNAYAEAGNRLATRSWTNTNFTHYTDSDAVSAVDAEVSVAALSVSGLDLQVDANVSDINSLNTDKLDVVDYTPEEDTHDRYTDTEAQNAVRGDVNAADLIGNDNQTDRLLTIVDSTGTLGWREVQAGEGMETHGNEWHDPDFAVETHDHTTTGESAIPNSGLVNDSIGVNGTHGLSGSSGSLGGSITIEINGNLELDADLRSSAEIVIWDDMAQHIPVSVLETDTVTVAGNAVSLGGSTSVAHADLSMVSSDDHHQYPVPNSGLVNDDITVTGTNGLSGGSASLGGSLSVGITGNLELDADLVSTSAITIWDETAQHVPTGILEADTVTVAGNAVSLGGSTAVAHADLSTVTEDDHHDWPVPNSGLVNDDITVTGTNGLSGGSASLGGSLSVGITGNLELDADLVSTSAITIWDETAQHVPTPVLEADTVTVAGNAVSLGGSTTINHGDLSTISANDHHTRYADAEAVSAVESESLLTLSGDVAVSGEIAAINASGPANHVRVGSNPDSGMSVHSDTLAIYSDELDGWGFRTGDPYNWMFLVDQGGNGWFNGGLDVDENLNTGGDLDVTGDITAGSAFVLPVGIDMWADE